MPDTRSKTKGAAAGHRSAHAADAGGTMATVAHILLPLLAPQDRLSLFHCNKGLAEAVLRHQQHFRLVLRAKGSSPADSDSRAAAAMQLASNAPSVAVYMHNRVFKPPEPLWPRITTLTLWGISLPDSRLAGLVQLGPAMHMKLCLEGCAFANAGSRDGEASGAAGSSKAKQGAGAGTGKKATRGAAGGIAAADASAAPAPLAVRALECVDCTPCQMYLSRALSLVSKGQLVELNLKDMVSCPDQAMLSELPALKRLSLPQASLYDSDLQYFVDHSTVNDLTIGRAYSALTYAVKFGFQYSHLQRICIRYGCDTHRLATLPLARSKCVVRGYLDVDWGSWRKPYPEQQLAILEANKANIAAECFPTLNKPSSPPVPFRGRASDVSTPLSARNEWYESPAQPSFTIYFPSPYFNSSHQVPIDFQKRLMTLVCGCLPAGTLLMLHGAARQVLAAIPASITALGYANPCHREWEDENFMSDAKYLRELIAATPSHVNSLAVSGWALKSKEIQAIIRGLHHDFKVYIHNLLFLDLPAEAASVEGDERDDAVRDILQDLVTGWAKKCRHTVEVQVVGEFRVCTD